ncbi:MAG: biotin transporter BioY [Vampirovibrio sp.]|nr:biotin transporter BioY [Vampirovibrio sp.]
MSIPTDETPEDFQDAQELNEASEAKEILLSKKQLSEKQIITEEAEKSQSDEASSPEQTLKTPAGMTAVKSALEQSPSLELRPTGPLGIDCGSQPFKGREEVSVRKPAVKTLAPLRDSGEKFRNKNRQEVDLNSISYRINRSPGFSFNSLLTACLCLLGLIALGFTELILPVPEYLKEIQPDSSGNLTSSSYVLLIPAAVLIGAFLGPLMGGLSVFSYLVLSFLGLPLFAHGGGPAYLWMPGAGYLLGMPIAAVLAGRWTSTWFHHRNKQPSFINLVLACVTIGVGAVLAAHLVGAIVIGVQGLLGTFSWLECRHWFFQMSLLSVAYDILFAIGSMLLVRPIRFLTWPVLY